MTEQWQELKETITEMRDSGGTGTQQEACKFLATYMETLEKYMRQPCEDCISREDAVGIVARIKEMHIDDRERYQINYGTICDIDLALQQLPPVTPQPKSGKWIDVGATHSQCDKCLAVFEIVSANGEANFCPNCGAKMEVEDDNE